METDGSGVVKCLLLHEVLCSLYGVSLFDIRMGCQAVVSKSVEDVTNVL